MKHHLFSPSWAEAVKTAINTDPHFKAVGARWQWPVAFAINAAPALGFPLDVAVQFDLKDGVCLAARACPLDQVDAPYVFRADYSTWKELATGTLDALTAVSKKRVIFTGSLPRLLMHAKAAKALVACAERVPTYFPDA